MLRFATPFVFCLALVVAFSGCATTGESAEANKLTEHVGIYSQPPLALIPVRLGVPNFTDARPKEKAQATVANLAALAAAQLTTLAVDSGRFDVIERNDLEQLLKEQNLEGIVNPREMAKAGKVSGVDYLMYGKVTNFRCKVEKSSTGFNIGALVSKVGGVEIGALDLKSGKTKITVDVGVDLKVVNPTTGSIIAGAFSEYKKTDKSSVFGMSLLGANAHADGRIDIGEDDQGLILRLALDHAMRKILPKVDRRLLQIQRQKAAKEKK